MKFRVQVRQEVKDFLETLAPEPRRKLKLAIQALENEYGDLLPLRERLAGFHRLRVGGYRLIYRYLPDRVIECVFAKERSLVYHLFERELLERLRHEEKRPPPAGRVEEVPVTYGIKTSAKQKRPKRRTQLK